MATAFARFRLVGGLTVSPDTSDVTHDNTAEVTRHPIEDGSKLSDHIIVNPNSVQIQSFWTPRPEDDTLSPSGANRPQQAYDILSGVLNRKESLIIEIDGITYDPAALTKVGMPRAYDDGDGRMIPIEATVMQIVSGKTVKVKVAQGLKGKGAKKKTVAQLGKASLAAAAALELVAGDFTGAVALGTAAGL